MSSHFSVYSPSRVTHKQIISITSKLLSRHWSLFSGLLLILHPYFIYLAVILASSNIMRIFMLKLSHMFFTSLYIFYLYSFFPFVLSTISTKLFLSFSMHLTLSIFVLEHHVAFASMEISGCLYWSIKDNWLISICS